MVVDLDITVRSQVGTTNVLQQSRRSLTRLSLSKWALLTEFGGRIFRRTDKAVYVHLFTFIGCPGLSPELPFHFISWYGRDVSRSTSIYCFNYRVTPPSPQPHYIPVAYDRPQFANKGNLPTRLLYLAPVGTIGQKWLHASFITPRKTFSQANIQVWLLFSLYQIRVSCSNAWNSFFWKVSLEQSVHLFFFLLHCKWDNCFRKLARATRSQIPTRCEFWVSSLSNLNRCLILLNISYICISYII